MPKPRHTAFRRELIALIHKHMPWPFSDVERDSVEARDTAKAIAREPFQAITDQFDEMAGRRELVIKVTETPGRCRWCGCTDERGCANGCSWINRPHTLCSGCRDIDRLVRTASGRGRLAEVIQEHADEALLS